LSGGPSEAEGEEAQDNDGEDDIIFDDDIINIFFEKFTVRPCKLKVDYQPEDMDVNSFRDGNYVEILNLCPLEEMILRLQPVEMQALTGWGSVFRELAGRWIEDICATQAHKFFTRASPFQPFSNLGDPLYDLAMVLVLKPEGSIADYFKGIIGGTTSFVGKVGLEALSTSAKLTRFAANQLSSKALPSSSLARRPKRVPRHAGEAAGHAYESVTRGLREANYTIVTVPLREYRNSGAGGAAKSAMKGIPIGVIAPIAGASEALSYTLLGLRNSLRPDLLKEDEASVRGLGD
jgi:autophagy-related protein 2